MKRVVFDIDDVLNNLCEHTYELAGIDGVKLLEKKKYIMKETDNLTESQINKILKLWEDEYTYTSCSAQDGIADIGEISKEPDVEVIIHSYCMNKQAASAKESWVSDRIDTAYIHFIMEIANKNPLDGVYAVVEDNLEYLMKYKAPVKILINKPYNQAENYNMKDSDYGITRVNSTCEAIKIIKELIKNGETRD